APAGRTSPWYPPPVRRRNSTIACTDRCGTASGRPAYGFARAERTPVSRSSRAESTPCPRASARVIPSSIRRSLRQSYFARPSDGRVACLLAMSAARAGSTLGIAVARLLALHQAGSPGGARLGVLALRVVRRGHPIRALPDRRERDVDV